MVGSSSLSAPATRMFSLHHQDKALLLLSFNIMQQQRVYFLQKMGITVWKKQTVSEAEPERRPECAGNEPEHFQEKNAPLWIVFEQAHHSELEPPHNNLVHNIAKAMQLPSSNWLELSSTKFEALLSHRNINHGLPMWVWFVGFSQIQLVKLRAKAGRVTPDIQVVTSCLLDELSQSKQEKAKLWQQISTFLK